MSDKSETAKGVPAGSSTGEEDLLEDTLKRCSKDTLKAAKAFRESRDPALVPTIVFGIVERFLDPDRAERLREGDDSLRFMEDLGMDSLTMMEAIIMVEESLGVSIKNEELLELRTLGDLKQFIGEKVTGLASGKRAERFAIEQVAALMPQQDPFLFLQEVTLEGASGRGSYAISGKEPILEGHFKGNPVFPASIMLEALGQLAVFYLLRRKPEELGLGGGAALDAAGLFFAGADGVRCHRVCRPGDKLELEVALKRTRSPLAFFSGGICVGGEKAVAAEEIILAVAPADGGNGGPRP